MANIASANISTLKEIRFPTMRGKVIRVISDGTGVTIPVGGATQFRYILFGNHTSYTISNDTMTITVPAGTNLQYRNFILGGP